uniref:SIS domain-containing protein n=1 Tax=Arabidopsis thaliana TaxID=3702 RepID=Q8LEI8_ARATH|nr:unknown [Arabidopsis thaliana]
MANEKAQEMANLSSQICNQISSVFTKPTSPYPPPLDLLVTELTAISRNRNNSRIFLYGVGREGLMLKAFAMRLFHLGLPTHLVFDMTTPPISSSDLLIASAGPGGFSTVDALCSVAKSNGAKVILITAEPAIGSCVKHATDVCYVPAQTRASDNGGGDSVEMGERRLLPMGSVYEGALFVLFEMVVYKLGEVLGESSESVRARHTNLE